MNRSFLRKSLVVAGCAVIAFVLSTGLGLAATVGQELSNPQIRDANDKPASIPDFGTHVITVTYADSSAGDYGDPMNDATKAKNYSKASYRGIGVANMKDSNAPNFLIRKIVRGKIEKYKSVILTDPDLTLIKTNTDLPLQLPRFHVLASVRSGSVRITLLYFSILPRTIFRIKKFGAAESFMLATPIPR